MKKYFFKILVLIGITGFMAIDIKAQLTSEISSDLATKRTDRYLQYKKPVLDDLVDNMNEETSIQINASEFTGMIQIFASNSFTGFRVYFAQILNLSNPTNNQNIKKHLTLTFVPTKNINNKEVDQENFAYYFLYNNATNPTLTRVRSTPDDDKKGVKRQIKAYQLTRISSLENAPNDDDTLDLSNFKETKSLWYDIKVLTDNETTLGLWTYIQLGHTLSNVTIQFAGRNLDEQFEHHLDIVTKLDFLSRADSTESETFYLGNKGNGNTILKDSLLTTIYKQLQRLQKEDSTLMKKISQKKSTVNNELINHSSLLASILKNFRDVIEIKNVDTGNPCPTKKCRESLQYIQ